jgi:hypothetical protein
MPTDEKSRLEKLLENLKASQKLHFEVWEKTLNAYDGAFYPVDFLAQAVLNRSLNLVEGFVTLAQQRNLICCGALLRLQLDNCLRFYAVYLVKDPHDFAMQVFGGTPIKKFKDKSGKLMTDTYLAQKLNEKYPWVLNVYKRTSGYIHLSETHIFNTFLESSKDDGTQEMGICIGSNLEGDELFEEATEAFTEATKVMFEYLIGWQRTKANPPKRK